MKVFLIWEKFYKTQESLQPQGSFEEAGGNVWGINFMTPAGRLQRHSSRSRPKGGPGVITLQMKKSERESKSQVQQEVMG